MTTELHHILPRCLGGTDDPSNLVELTYEEHKEAHLILHILNRQHQGLRSAYLMMYGETEEGRREIQSQGGRARQALPGAREQFLAAASLGGKVQGRINVESGQLASVRPVFDNEHQRRASARASRKVQAIEDPSVISSWNQRRRTEQRLGKTFTWQDYNKEEVCN